tara:strand:+ start:630 stop:1157 length:528 start_codon:yes stop_codon:yes gene_type:complete
MLKSIDLEKTIAKVPDYPKPGILYYDISTLLMDSQAWKTTVKRLTGEISQFKPDIIAGIESRGFLLAGPVALDLAVGVQMIRKQGKLPGATLAHTYDLEYGHDTLEVQKNSALNGKRVAIVDDIFATGGTLNAATALIRKQGSIVVCSACVLELAFLKGKDKLDAPFISLIQVNE